ncbi:MAG TPA: hypothetical protein PK869_03290 [Candidatus Hydrogenedentes bacterium]|mgnify:CR=1 FL=1|nr:hypothetical protein [Candidatus Hydrogenedentota bacterium]
MITLLADAISYAFSLAAHIAGPASRRQLSKFSLAISRDIPHIGTAWAVQFEDPTRQGSVRLRGIDANLQQYGRHIRGIGHIQGEPTDLFQYEGILKRNVFYGTFWRKNSHVLAGTGTFVLKVNADSRRMTGQCMWYDNTLDDVWLSNYEWNRKG